eukprot:4331611-Amphidinium_carterae.1
MTLLLLLLLLLVDIAVSWVGTGCWFMWKGCRLEHKLGLKEVALIRLQPVDRFFHRVLSSTSSAGFGR